MGSLNNVIINADDFGLNDQVNQGISYAFKKGFINSTSIMTNMEGFYSAVSLSILQGFDSQIGLHVSLTEGRSISDLSSTGLIDKEGYFIKNNIYKPQFFLTKSSRILIKDEIVRQLQILIQNGISPTHINSHHHIHTLPWLATLFLEIARDFNIPIRIAQTWSKGNWLVDYYRKKLNKTYHKNNIKFSDCFETLWSIRKPEFNLRCSRQTVEIMVHPSLDSDGHLYDTLDGYRYLDFEEIVANHLLFKKL